MKARKPKNHCSWCGKPTVMESMQLADTPILEFMEDKINNLVGIKYGVIKQIGAD